MTFEASSSTETRKEMEKSLSKLKKGRARDLIHRDKSVKKRKNEQEFVKHNWVSKDSSLAKGTTLVEHVPYSHIHDVKAEIDELTKHLDEMNVLHKDTKECIFGQAFVDQMRLTGRKAGRTAVTVGPALQVDYVRIFNQTSPSWDAFLVYGEITVTDDDNNRFYVYKCASDYCDQVSPEWNYLFLDYSPSIAPVVRGKVHVHLTSKEINPTGRCLPSFNGVLDVMESYQEEGACILKLDGGYGYFAEIRFTKTQFGGICHVQMALHHMPSDHTDVSTYGVYGIIQVNNVASFHTHESDACEVTPGKKRGIGQFRKLFAVPVYSGSDVKIDLYKDGKLVFGKTVTIYPNINLDNRSNIYQFPSDQDESLKLVMDVVWARHEDFFGGFFHLDGLKVEWKSNSLIRQIYEPHEEIETSKSPLVEVFSVIVAARGSSATYPLALCGKILVRDANAENYIFVRNKDFPEKLSLAQSRSVVSLAWPSTDDGWIVEKDFLMHLKLEDINGRTVTVGTLRFPDRYASCTMYNTLYDRRMCDFIQGENGYFVAVHYSIFKNGKKARIYINWKGRGSLVYGSVVAEYGNQRYLSIYDNKFYKSIIFKRSEEECLKVKKELQLPLSKSNISAPSSCEMLTVCVHLLHRPFNSPTSVPIPIKHDIHFKVGCDSESDLKYLFVKMKWF